MYIFNKCSCDFYCKTPYVSQGREQYLNGGLGVLCGNLFLLICFTIYYAIDINGFDYRINLCTVYALIIAIGKVEKGEAHIQARKIFLRLKNSVPKLRGFVWC
jgi:hypothetical protein